jgi:hypothetical protein
MAVTVWGPEFLEPATTAFWAAVGTKRPDLVGGFHPWTRLTEPAALAQLFRDGGAAAPTGGRARHAPVGGPGRLVDDRAGQRVPGHRAATRPSRGTAGTAGQRRLATPTWWPGTPRWPRWRPT